MYPYKVCADKMSVQEVVVSAELTHVRARGQIVQSVQCTGGHIASMDALR